MHFISVGLVLSISFGFSILFAASPVLTVEGDRILLDGEEVKVLGLRCSNALISDKTAKDLVDRLGDYQAAGLNTVSVFLMGSRFGDVKGYRPNGSLDPAYRKRFETILDEAGRRKMVVIVGCLYWSTSRAKEELGGWTQADADKAIANTAAWLKEKGYRNVILDPDNEGMACREKMWRVESMIAAARAANPELVIANNTKQDPPNEDLNMYFGKPERGKPWFDSEATPKNAPGGYWGRFSKETHQKDKGYYNYSRIGRYTQEMKEDQIRQTREGLTRHSGHILASTWVQCSPAEGVGGPFTAFGGTSEMGSGKDTAASWNKKIDTLHSKAGIQWWIDALPDLLADGNSRSAKTPR